MIFADVWTIINNITVFYNIVSRHFHIHKNDLIFEKIEVIKQLRHTNQHIDERISEALLDMELPIYGSLSWYAQKEPDSAVGKIMSIDSGSVTHKKTINMLAVNPTGKDNSHKINDIEFSTVVKVNKKTFDKRTINLNELMMNLDTIIKYFENQMEEQLRGEDASSWHINDLILAMDVMKI